MAPSLANAALDAETSADLRCVAVGFRMAQMTNPQVKSSGQLLTIYYIGRLDGHSAALDLEGSIIEQVIKMDEATFRTEATRCGNILTAKGQQLTRISEELTKRSQQLQQGSAPSK
jgi:hypothetical protein